MPKRRLNINTFAGLASPALDDEDVPLEGASFASGLDPTERPGRLRGFPEDKATGLGHPVKAQAMLDGGDTVVFWDGSNVRQITGAEDGIDGSSSLVNGGGGFSTPEQVQMTSDGERIYMARGDALPAKWIGKFRRQHVHDTSLPSGLQIEDAAPAQPEGTALSVLTEQTIPGREEDDTSSNFEEGSIYQFAFSWTYDGFQEGPLKATGIVFEGRGEEALVLRLDWSSRGAFDTPRRVTHLNLYGITNAANRESPLETGVPRLLETIPVDDDGWSQSTGPKDIKSLSAWDIIEGRARYWYSLSGPKRVTAYPHDYDYTAALDIADFTSQELTAVEVKGNLLANKDTDSALAEIEVRVVDSSRTVLDSQTEVLEKTSGDPTGKITTNYTITLSSFTAANAAAIEIYMHGAAGQDNDYIGVEVESIAPSLSGGSLGETYSQEIEWTGTESTTYANRVGLSPTADQPQINYTVSAEHSGFHFVSGASVDGEDYGSYIFRSKAKRFSQFAWAQDYLNLDTKIHSLTSFNGRLWAFSQSAVYRIDANTLTVEREYKGKGALGHRSITRSPLGLFWVNEENLFLHDGRELRDVGGPIKAGDFQEVWANLSTTEAPMTWYDPQNNVLVVAFRCIQQNLIPNNEMWMLHFPEERWTDAIPGPRWMHLIPPEAWSANSNLQESFLGADGVPYFSVGDDLYSFATASAKRPWEWVSKKITGGQPGIEKVFYHADIKGDTPTSVSYKEDEGAWQTASLEATNENRSRWPVNSGAAAPPWKGVYHFRLKIEGAGGDEVSSVSFLIRPRSRTR